MSRLQLEREYWDKATNDPALRDNWIVDKTMRDEDFISLLKPLLKGLTLEIGCGIGRLSELYDCGIDISPKMLEKITNKKEHKLTDGRSIPYPDNYFNSVFSVALFQHLPNPQPYLNEAYRVLKPTGAFIVQYIKGNQANGPFSYEHTLSTDNWAKTKEMKGIHPLWTWAILTK